MKPFILPIQLQKATGCSEANAKLFLPHLEKSMLKWGINTPRRIVAFLAQIGHESGSLTFKVESLYYKSAARLMAVYPKYFKKESVAVGYLKNSEKVANFVYANRMGNGDVASGDGFKYRGRGLIQITGKNNYRAIGTIMGVDLLAHPELLEQPEWSVEAACAYWYVNNLNELADKNMHTAISKVINLGNKNSTAIPNGIEDRLARVKAGNLAFGVA